MPKIQIISSFKRHNRFHQTLFQIFKCAPTALTTSSLDYITKRRDLLPYRINGRSKPGSMTTTKIRLLLATVTSSTRLLSSLAMIASMLFDNKFKNSTVFFNWPATVLYYGSLINWFLRRPRPIDFFFSFCFPFTSFSQLILKTKITSPLEVQFVVLCGPYGEFKLKVRMA